MIKCFGGIRVSQEKDPCEQGCRVCGYSTGLEDHRTNWRQCQEHPLSPRPLQASDDGQLLGLHARYTWRSTVLITHLVTVVIT